MATRAFRHLRTGGCVRHDGAARSCWRHLALAFVAPLAAGQIVADARAQPGLQPEVPVVLGHEPDLDACGAIGVVAGLRAGGDGFLAVRGGPGTGYGKLDEITNGQTVFVCDRKGEWYAIVYSDDVSDGCGVTSPWPAVAAYTGPCRSGWAHRNWITITAG